MQTRLRKDRGIYKKLTCPNCGSKDYVYEGDERPSRCFCDEIVEHSCICGKRISLSQAWQCDTFNCGCKNDLTCSEKCHIDMETEQGLNPNE